MPGTSLIFLVLFNSQCSFRLPSIDTVTLSVPPDAALQDSPALAALSCFFINIVGSDVTKQTPANLASNCAPSLEIGAPSKVVTLAELQAGVTLTGVTSGANGTVQILGVAHPAGLCPTGATAFEALFTEAREIADIYVIGTAPLPDLKPGENAVDVSSIYNPVTATNLTTGCRNIWRETAPAGPEVRDAHTAVWTGTKMIIWGGEDGSGLDSGGIYDPNADSWAPTSSTSAPQNRWFHSAVYVGSKMIIWGGSSSGSYLDTGGVYDVASDSWTPTSTVSAPVGRTVHTAVSTGSKMVVWGGKSDTGNETNTGGVYSPLTDSWTATSTTSVPGARRAHSTVFTGSKMIVWGGGIGAGAGAAMNSGGIYDPAEDSWAATSTVSAPDSRQDHTAVFTGSKMVIWGGLSVFTNTNSGGIYDPTSNSWTATNTTGAPTERYGHTAIFTGSRMIVWGGFMSSGGGTITSDSGGIYDPSADSWTATALAPGPKTSHTALWTGSKMLVWGGADQGGAPTSTGGVYWP